MVHYVDAGRKTETLDIGTGSNPLYLLTTQRIYIPETRGIHFYARNARRRTRYINQIHRRIHSYPLTFHCEHYVRSQMSR